MIFPPGSLTPCLFPSSPWPYTPSCIGLSPFSLVSLHLSRFWPQISFVKKAGWSWGSQHPAGPALRLLTRSGQDGAADSAAIALGCACPRSQGELEDPAGGVGLTCPAADHGTQSSPFAFVDGCATLLCGARVEPGARPGTEALGAPSPRPTEGAKAVTASKRPHIAGRVDERAVPRFLVGSLLPAGVCGAPRPFLLARPPPPHAPLQPPARPQPLSGIRHPRRGRAAESRDIPRGRLTLVNREDPRGGGRAAGWGPETQCRSLTGVRPYTGCKVTAHSVRLRAPIPSAGTYARRSARGLNLSQTSVCRLIN